MDIKKVLQLATSEASTLKTEVKELSRIHAELLKVEAKECADYIKKKIAAGVLLAGIAFFFLCVFLTALIATLGVALKAVLPDAVQPYSWQIVAFLFCALFGIFMGVLIQKLKKKPESPFFSHSKQEFNNNRVWLQNLTKQENTN